MTEAQPPPKGRLGRPLGMEYMSAALPLRQEVALRVDLGNRIEAMALSVVEEAAFVHFDAADGKWSGIGSEARPSLLWAGERGLRRRGTSSSTRDPMIVVFVAGIILGSLDAYIVGSVLVGAYWVLGGAGVAGLFWLRFGGTYESDIVSVMVFRPGHSTGPIPPAVTVVYSAGRIQSNIQATLRVPAVVNAPLRLAREVGSFAREFQRRVNAELSPTTRAGPRSSPPPRAV